MSLKVCFFLFGGILLPAPFDIQHKKAGREREITLCVVNSLQVWPIEFFFFVIFSNISCLYILLDWNVCGYVAAPRRAIAHQIEMNIQLRQTIESTKPVQFLVFI